MDATVTDEKLPYRDFLCVDYRGHQEGLQEVSKANFFYFNIFSWVLGGFVVVSCCFRWPDGARFV